MHGQVTKALRYVNRVFLIRYIFPLKLYYWFTWKALYAVMGNIENEEKRF